MKNENSNIDIITVIGITILIYLGIWFVGYKMINHHETPVVNTNNITQETQTSNKVLVDPSKNNNKTSSTIKSKRTVNMSKHHLSFTYGEASNVYNDMLDALGKEDYAEYSCNENGKWVSTMGIDINNLVMYSEEKNGKYWAELNGTTKISYSFNYAQNYWKKNEWTDIKQYSYDFVRFFLAMPFCIKGSEGDYRYSLVSNVNKNQKNCYQIIATYIGSLDNQYVVTKISIFVDMETKLIVEIENIFKGGRVGIYTFSYPDKTLTIPAEAKNAKEE